MQEPISAPNNVGTFLQSPDALKMTKKKIQILENLYFASGYSDNMRNKPLSSISSCIKKEDIKAAAWYCKLCQVPDTKI